MASPHWCSVVLSTLLLLPSAGLAADEPGTLGVEVAMGQTSSIGGRLRLGDRWLIRPAVTYWRQASDNTSTISDINEPPPVYKTTDRYFGLGLGIGYEISVTESARLSLGVGGRIARNDASYADLDEDGKLVFRNDPLTRWGGSVTAGCEYLVSGRLGLFGEVGLLYQHGERFVAGGYKLDDSTWTTLSTGIGVVFYLR